MKILMTTDLYKPTINGVVTSIETLKEALEAQGHDVRVLTLDPILRLIWNPTSCLPHPLI